MLQLGNEKVKIHANSLPLFNQQSPFSPSLSTLSKLPPENSLPESLSFSAHCQVLIIFFTPDTTNDCLGCQNCPLCFSTPHHGLLVFLSLWLVLWLILTNPSLNV